MIKLKTVIKIYAYINICFFDTQTCDNGKCDCQLYLKEKGYYGNETFPVVTSTAAPVVVSTTASPFDVVDNTGTSVLGQIDPSTMQNSCGVQLYAGTSICAFSL